MAVNGDRLFAALRAAGLPVNGGGPCPARYEAAGWNTWHDRADGVFRLGWSSQQTAQQESAANAIVQAHDGTPTVGERLDAVTHRPRVQAALVLRASTQWASLSAQRKALVQQVLDDAAADLVALLG